MNRGISRRQFLVRVAATGAALALSSGRAGVEQFVPVEPSSAENPQWKAGLAKVLITPTKSVWMTGYGARTKPSEGTLQELYAKALALEDQSGRRAVLVTTDILGFPAEVADTIAKRVEKEHGISRDRLLLNSSHTHCGPAIHSPIRLLYGARSTPGQLRDVEEYTRELEEKVVSVVGEAVKDLRPARLRFGHAEAKFGGNRRKKTETGYVIGVNPEGPVDHDVPVLRVDSEEGDLRGVVFGYACHNTTLSGNMYQFNGDYAGFAQERFEKDHPGATAFFVIGCGGDINPEPRGTVELARQHGETLAAAVGETLNGPLRPVRGLLNAALETVPLAFGNPPSREALEGRLQHSDPYHRWYAEQMLKVLERDGRLPPEYPCPLQVWQFGQDLTLIAIGGEVVVDYALRLKKEFGAEKLWVAGYSNDVFAYVPSLRVLEEGGYEAEGAMTYYVQPGRFAPSVEETIIRKIHELVERVRVLRPPEKVSWRTRARVSLSPV